MWSPRSVVGTEVFEMRAGLYQVQQVLESPWLAEIEFGLVRPDTIVRFDRDEQI
jgi:hypothetical protein